MIVHLFKSKRMFSLTLPEKVAGQYWLTDIDDAGRYRHLISVEALEGNWVLKSNQQAAVLGENGTPVDSSILSPLSFLRLGIANSSENILLFTENEDNSRCTFSKIVMTGPEQLTIGRAEGCGMRYNSRFVSSSHARLDYNGSEWSITDLDSTNGTYVNGFRVSQARLSAGDLIHIMGLKIVVGSGFFAVNNPDGLLSLYGEHLMAYQPQRREQRTQNGMLHEQEVFSRQPRLYTLPTKKFITIDAPPQAEKPQRIPTAFMMGPSVTMALTSLCTAAITVNNTLSSGGKLLQAAPSLLMAVSMLLSAVLWPVLTKRYEKKKLLEWEQCRQQKYLAYLDELRDEISRSCQEQSHLLLKNNISPDECLDIVLQQEASLWNRTPNQPDYLSLRLGLGRLPLDAEIRCPEKKFTMDDDSLQGAMLALGKEPKLLENVPVLLPLMQENIAGFYGDRERVRNLLKVLLLQIITLCGYDELKLVLITDEPGKWEFVRFLPHCWSDDRTVRWFATNEEETKELSAHLELEIAQRMERAGNRDTSPVVHYVIISTSPLLTNRCEAVQHILSMENNIGFSVLLAADQMSGLPKETKAMVEMEAAKARVFFRRDTTGKPIEFVPDSLNEAVLYQVAQRLANVELGQLDQSYTMPNMLTFLEMYRVGKIEHLNVLTRWKENNPTISLSAPIGVDPYGDLFTLDLHEKAHGPHGLVAGMTGSGKSEFIITYILSLAVNYHPNEVAFILIDYKGGGLAGAFEDEERGIHLPHLAGTITNLDGAAINRSLASVQSELRRRQAIFNEARRISNEGTMDIYKYQQLYREGIVTEPMPHLFIISDEFAELKAQQPEFMEQLISTARIGRSLGVHLILATQKPNGVVNEQIWSNSRFRVCLKVQETADSQDMIKRPDAAALTQTGRFYLQVGYNELFALGQSAWCGAEYQPTDTLEQRIDSSVQVVDNLGRVLVNAAPARKEISHERKIKQVVAIVKYLSDLALQEGVSTRPMWLPAIPALIYQEELEKKYELRDSGFVLAPVVGEYDDPHDQQQFALTLPLSAEGNCLLYGSTGSGKTTFLTTLCYALIKNHNPEEVNLYIMDFGSETLRVFADAPQVGGVMTSGDRERIVSLFKLLNKELSRRKILFSDFGGDHASYCKNSGSTVPNIVVVMNNYAVFAEQYEDFISDIALLSRDGTKYGIFFVVTASNTNAVRYTMLQNFKNILSLQLNDATEYPVLFGRTGGMIPSRHKGSGLIRMGRLFEFQTAHCTAENDTQQFLMILCRKLAAETDARAQKVPVLPRCVRTADICAEANGLHRIPVGMNKDTLAVASVNLEDKVVLPVVAQDMEPIALFGEEWCKQLAALAATVVVDPAELLDPEELKGCTLVNDDYEHYIVTLFNEMVSRHKHHKAAAASGTTPTDEPEQVVVLVGYLTIMKKLAPDGKDKLRVLLANAKAEYKIHFILLDTKDAFVGAITSTEWYRQQASGKDGIWLGDGFLSQNLFNLSRSLPSSFNQLDEGYGFLVSRGRAVFTKLAASRSTEEESA